MNATATPTKIGTSARRSSLIGGASFAAAALALALALGAADDAAAQSVCRGDPPADPAQRIVCEEVSGSANIVIRASNLDIATSEARARGVFARRVRAGGSVGIDIDGGAIATSGQGASGVHVWHSGAAGAVGIDLNDAVVTTSGAYANGVWGDVTHPHNVAALTVGVTGGAVTAEGVGAVGVGARHDGLGSVALTVGAGAEVRAPFSIGAEGRLGRHHGNPDERLVVSHGGTIEARDTGILAWAARRSGHTFGAGAQTADDAARTEPMVHVTSSGDVTVGEAATDAFIRAAIAGADGALSAGEKAVYAAIVAEDSEELGAALAALPAADYDAAWRARANALLTNRGHEPTDVAEEILGLTRSGIRALALPLDIIVAWVQEGVETTSTLSPAERTVLAAVLTGGDLEAALAALPRRFDDDYDADWMNEMREWAASYNAGDILVEVTGGTIAAEGDGVDARYAMTHDRNGAIAVTVADGATVSGGRHGVHVGGAGVAASGALRDQTVTVNGAVRGGTGAGIHLAGGGTVVVGRTGRVGATSGVGILSEGAGDLVATVAGTVEGDVRAMGGGALTVDVKEGGAVTGTVHDPAGPLTVHGSVGRLLYGAGGTVTVADTGRITGVAGEADAIRSAAGDLSLTVAGAVEGDVRATGGGDLDATIWGVVEGDLLARDGGALRVEVKDGGVVTGTLHDPAGPLTVEGSIGRLLYSAGGTVTIGGAGRLPRLTGVAVEGGREAVRSAAGDLAVRVETKGRVTGDVLGMGDGGLRILVAGTLRGDIIEEGAGDLSATISGMVEGNVFGRGTGAHAVTVSKDGTVTGTIHLSASTVTVDGAAGRVLFDRGGRVTIGPQGRITDPGIGIEARGGELVVVIRQDAGETPGAALSRGVRGAIVEEGGTPDVLTQREGEAARRVPVGTTGTAPSLPDGARDVGLMQDGPGFRVVSDYAPRSRVYEALPSVLLGLNDLPTHRDRLAAARSSNGAWARVDAEGGERRVKRSTSASGAGIAYDHRRYGVQTGFDVPLGADGMAGVSAHYRRGSAELSGKDGEIEASGVGFGVSGAWRFPDGIYVDGQIAATWYEAEVKSGSRGVLKSDARGFGHALGLEAGRRIALGAVTLTPHARMAYSRVEMKDFADVLGNRVSVEKGRSVTGGAGLRVETAPSGRGGGRLFASVEVERELTAETRVRVSGAELSSERDPTRVRLELGGVHEWSEGRYALQGAAGYTAGGSGNRDYGGTLSLKMRF